MIIHVVAREFDDADGAARLRGRPRRLVLRRRRLDEAVESRELSPRVAVREEQLVIGGVKLHELARVLARVKSRAEYQPKQGVPGF